MSYDTFIRKVMEDSIRVTGSKQSVVIDRGSSKNAVRGNFCSRFGIIYPDIL